MIGARLAPLLAVVGLVAAVVGALGPAERVRTSYSWPPAAITEESPARLWYTPLLLTKHRPEAMSVRVPCVLPPPLPRAARPLTVLASTRSPDQAGGLVLLQEGDGLIVGVGTQVLARVDIGSEDPACVYRLALGERRWTLEGGRRRIARSGPLAAMPVVYGLFTGVDLRRGAGPAVELLTGVHETRTTPRQAVAWTIAAAAIVAALLLVAVDPKRGRPRTSLASVGKNVRAVDAVVGIVLIGWWLISPAFFDDGWIVAKQSMFSASRGFSTYYVMFATNAPLGYWLDWLQHWLTQSTSLLVVLRLPVLVALVLVWILCRYVLARVLASSVVETAVALFGLAAAFLVGALAWGMTLRPEPVTALLVTGTLACVVRFRERESAAPLAVAAVLAPLAISAHPSGIVALAPILAAVPALASWLPRQLRVATTIMLASVALLTLLAFVGSDLDGRRSDVEAVRSYGGIVDWYDELTRYDLLSSFPYGTPLRRLSVALLVLAILAFALRPRWGRRGLLGLPAIALVLGAALLVATPSKWPWHFGTLIGLIAVAVGAETARLWDERRRASGWRIRPFLAVAAALLAGAWAWATRASWNLGDLRVLDWKLGFEDRFPLGNAVILLPVLLTVGAILLAVLRRRADARYEEPWRIASWTAAILAIPVIAFTLGVLVADSAKTESWTLARGNARALAGDAGCGLADNIVVPVLSSARASPASRDVQVLQVSAGAPSRTSWFELPASAFGLFVAGVPGLQATLELQWGRVRGDGVVELGRDEVTSVIEELPDAGRWQFYAAGELPEPDPRATHVRVVLRTSTGTGAQLAVRAPVPYSSEPLARPIGRTAPTLVHPDLLPYFPCARLPRLQRGVAEPARYLVAAGHPALPREYVLSPLAGLGDVLGIERLSTADSESPPDRIFVYEVREPEGAVAILPSSATVVS